MGAPASLIPYMVLGSPFVYQVLIVTQMSVGQIWYSNWSPGKWNQGLTPAVPWCFSFDPQPNGGVHFGFLPKKQTHPSLWCILPRDVRTLFFCQLVGFPYETAKKVSHF